MKTVTQSDLYQKYDYIEQRIAKIEAETIMGSESSSDYDSGEEFYQQANESQRQLVKDLQRQADPTLKEKRPSKKSLLTKMNPFKAFNRKRKPIEESKEEYKEP